MINFSQVVFKRIILHEILKKDYSEQCSKAILKDSLVDLTSEVEALMKRRLNESCGKQAKSFKAEIIKFHRNSFFELSESMILLAEEDFIHNSQEIARLLAESQTKSVNHGYLIVIDGQYYNNSVVIVIKADLQKAFQANHKNEKTSIEIIDNIFLSPSDKLYKIGYISKLNETNSNFELGNPNREWEAFVFDDQFNIKNKPANYFVDSFLGFSIQGDSKIVLRDYYRKTKDLITSNEKADAGDKQKAISALITLINDEKSTIDPYEYLNRFLPEPFKEDYNNVILKKYTSSITKDIGLISRELKKANINFSSGIKIIGDSSTIGEDVKIIETKDGHTQVSIKGSPYSK